MAFSIIILLIPLALNFYIRVSTSKYCYKNPEEFPAQAIAIVFGAGIWQDGTPTPMLADRVQGAINLYNPHSELPACSTKRYMNYHYYFEPTN